MQQEKTEEGNTLDKSLANIDKAIRGWELDKQSSRETGNKAGLDKANTQLARLYADREALEAKAQAVGSEKADLAETASLLDQVTNRWDSMRFDIQKRFVRLLVASANMQKVSPRVIKLDVDLRYFDFSMTGYLYLDNIFRADFTPDEENTIARLYSHADRLDILKALPDKTWFAIRRYAQRKGLRRVDYVNTSGIHEEISYNDFLVMQEARLDRNGAVWHYPPYQGTEILDAYMHAQEPNNGGLIVNGSDGCRP